MRALLHCGVAPQPAYFAAGSRRAPPLPSRRFAAPSPPRPAQALVSQPDLDAWLADIEGQPVVRSYQDSAAEGPASTSAPSRRPAASAQPPRPSATAAPHHSQSVPSRDAVPPSRLLTLFSLNDYLGLASHPDVAAAAARAAQQVGHHVWGTAHCSHTARASGPHVALAWLPAWGSPPSSHRAPAPPSLPTPSHPLSPPVRHGPALQRPGGGLHLLPQVGPGALPLRPQVARRPRAPQG
jgi:hypothetical protein